MRKLEISANDAFDTYREMYVYCDRLSINKLYTYICILLDERVKIFFFFFYNYIKFLYCSKGITREAFLQCIFLMTKIALHSHPLIMLDFLVQFYSRKVNKGYIYILMIIE